MNNPVITWLKRQLGQYGCLYLLMGLAGLYFFLMRPEIAGLWYDDGIYLLGSKAIAAGRGYRLLSEAGLPAIIKYPPLLACLLAPLWWLNPHAPDNLILFKTVSTIFGLGALAALYGLARQCYGLSAKAALLLMLLLGLNPVWLILVTEVMSEPLYLLLSLGLLWLGSRIDQRGSSPTLRERWAGVFLSVTLFYTRTIGIAAIFGMGYWLWRRFGAKLAIRYFLICAALCAPWILWTAGQHTGMFMLGHFYLADYNQTYFQELLLEALKAHGFIPLLWSNLLLFPANLLETLFPCLSGIDRIPSLLPFFTLAFLAGIGWFGWKVLRRNVSPVSIYAFFYLLACLLWYAHDQYPRLVIPVLPLLWLGGFQQAWPLLARWRDTRPTSTLWQKAMGYLLAAGLIATLQPWHIAAMSRGNAMASNVGPELWQDYRATFTAIRQLSQPGDIYWARYCSLYPLYTDQLVISRNIVPGPKAFASGELQEGRQGIGKILRAIFNHEKVTYLILEPRITGRLLVDPVDPATLNIIQSSPEHFKQVYTSPQGYIAILRYFP